MNCPKHSLKGIQNLKFEIDQKPSSSAFTWLQRGKLRLPPGFAVLRRSVACRRLFDWAMRPKPIEIRRVVKQSCESSGRVGARRDFSPEINAS